MNNVDNVLAQERISLAHAGPCCCTDTSKTLLRLIGKHIGKDVIDLGAGDGSLIQELRRRGHWAIGIDLVPRGAFVEPGDITHTGYGHNSFDTVILSAVLEHLTIDQIDLTLKTAQHVLRENGTLIAVVPDREKLLLNQCACPACGQVFHRFGHLQQWDREALTYWLETRGFAVTSIKTYALGAMAKLPLGRWLNWLWCRLPYESIQKLLVAVAVKA